MTLVDRMRARVARSGFGYPLWMALTVSVGALAAAAAAVVQRDAVVPPRWALVWALIAVSPVLFDLVTGGKMPRPLMALLAIAGASLLLVEPVESDFAPFILVILAAEVAATATLPVSLAAAVCMLGALVVPAAAGRLVGAPLYATAIVIGWTVGFVVLTQLRLLQQERAAQATRAEQAATGERQRIAREVHDVIAHSLSVTLLHLTAARRALQQDEDLDEAVAALTDAERQGRQAMADIRRTVGLLAAGPAGTRPEPGVDDLGDLVDDFRRAGLLVDYRVRGQGADVPPSVGLGLYRITQESLANVAKHTPDATAEVDLDIGADRVTLSVLNDTPVGPPASTEPGSGVEGMRRRADLLGGSLRAGPGPRGWLVHAEVPLDTESPGWSCGLRRRIQEAP
ncbi:sensor histidine kinase [Actinokineospora xionganensis]|nr:histidine kinase [Actinokineospora xionganensis]